MEEQAFPCHGYGASSREYQYGGQNCCSGGVMPRSCLSFFCSQLIWNQVGWVPFGGATNREGKDYQAVQLTVSL